MSKRIKNQADLSEYVKVFKSCLSSWTTEYMKADPDEVATFYFDFIDELHCKTPRPCKELLVKACKKVHPEVSDGEINLFGDRMTTVFKHLRVKARTSTSGKKLPKKIMLLVQRMKGCDSIKTHPSPSPEHNPPSSSSGTFELSSSAPSRASIFEMFGLELPSAKKTTLPIEDEVVEIEDSQPVQYEADLEWFDSHEVCLKRQLANGTVQKAVTTKGPNGFLIASFPGESAKQLDVPNLALVPASETIFKKPASKETKKRPAAALTAAHPVAECDGEDVTSDEGACDDDEVNKGPCKGAPAKVFFQYSAPYRYPNGTFALRRLGSVSKKQVCSAKGKHMPEDEVKRVLTEAQSLLNSGELCEEELKDWLSHKID